MPSKPVIATICSHSSLQIFHGARKEGFRTLGICVKGREAVYDAFPLAKPDEFIFVNRWEDVLSMEKALNRKNVILIPHGSFVEYVGAKNVENLDVPMFGNRKILEWESDRDKSRKWLTSAGLQMPEEIKSPDKIDRPVIVKYHGAKGGKGFFICTSPQEFEKNIDRTQKYTIQEYITGVRMYPHYFYSPLEKKGFGAGKGHVEMLSIDKRIESNIDEIFRLGMTREEKTKRGIKDSFTVVGNIPVIARESLLMEIFRMGKGAVDSSMHLFSPGIVGPFCLETIVTSDLKFYCFEISARIVAGTNLFTSGSPYMDYMFSEPMSTGRRIAREIKDAIKLKKLSEVVT
jgi:5-formaminoimidazole-4-carboxamide-1-(beta)-D-ribofuranosyl 5'-monophosphate synthetase